MKQDCDGSVTIITEFVKFTDYSRKEFDYILECTMKMESSKYLGKNFVSPLAEVSHIQVDGVSSYVEKCI